MRKRVIIATAFVGTGWIVGCLGAEQAPRVELPTVVSSAGITPAVTDLGYEVTVSEARAAISDIEFTVGGEAQVRRFDRVFGIRKAYAHPGHSSGGDVTGELRGDFIVDWTGEGQILGQATLIVGDYEGANFTFRRAKATDRLADDDPLLGHTFYLVGTATKDERSIAFEAALDIADPTTMTGAAFAYPITESSEVTLSLELWTNDEVEGDTIFDGIDFAALDDDGDGNVQIVPGTDVHNILVRNVQVHDHYYVTAN